jgi:hypothetical protein
VTEEILEFGEVRSLAQRLSRMPKEFRAETRKILRGAAGPFLSDAQAAASWSSRVPGSLSVRVSLGARRPGVSIRASLKVAEHARVYEGILGDTFAHPLFGDDAHWYRQLARPYLLPALDRQSDRIVDEVTTALDDISRRAGLS